MRVCVKTTTINPTHNELKLTLNDLVEKVNIELGKIGYGDYIINPELFVNSILSELYESPIVFDNRVDFDNFIIDLYVVPTKYIPNEIDTIILQQIQEQYDYNILKGILDGINDGSLFTNSKLYSTYSDIKELIITFLVRNGVPPEIVAQNVDIETMSYSIYLLIEYDPGVLLDEIGRRIIMFVLSEDFKSTRVEVRKDGRIYEICVNL